MKCFCFTLFLALLVSSFSEVKAQDVSTPVKQELSASTLVYQPEMPPVNSYKIIKNTTGQELADSVLLKINMKRMANEEVEWKVNEAIEILIFPINGRKPEGN